MLGQHSAIASSRIAELKHLGASIALPLLDGPLSRSHSCQHVVNGDNQFQLSPHNVDMVSFDHVLRHAIHENRKSSVHTPLSPPASIRLNAETRARVKVPLTYVNPETTRTQRIPLCAGNWTGWRCPYKLQPSLSRHTPRDSGRPLMGGGEPKEYITARIRVESCGYSSPCWVWQGCRTQKGYGVSKIPGRGWMRVHRAAYEAIIGPIPDGLTIDHLCLVKACCNPAHLEPVTNLENLRREWILRKQARAA